MQAQDGWCEIVKCVSTWLLSPASYTTLAVGLGQRLTLQELNKSYYLNEYALNEEKKIVSGKLNDKK